MCIDLICTISARKKIRKYHERQRTSSPGTGISQKPHPPPEDLKQLCAALKKVSIEAALGSELNDPLGYDSGSARTGSNSRNGYSNKTVLTGNGELAITFPRDLEGSFEPQIVKKHQRRITSMDDQILALYAKGMTNQEIVEFFKELYDADVSPTLISTVTDAVLERVVAWHPVCDRINDTADDLTVIYAGNAVRQGEVRANLIRL